MTIMTVMASWFCFKVVREKENNFTGLNNCQCSRATVPIHWVSHLQKPKDQRAGQCQVVERSSCSTSRKMTSLSSLQPAPRPPWPTPDGAHFSWCQTIDPYGMVTTNQRHNGELHMLWIQTWPAGFHCDQCDAVMVGTEWCVCLYISEQVPASIFRGGLVN